MVFCLSSLFIDSRVLALFVFCLFGVLARASLRPFLPSDMRPIMAPIASVDESSEPSIAEGQERGVWSCPQGWFGAQWFGG